MIAKIRFNIQNVTRYMIAHFVFRLKNINEAYIIIIIISYTCLPYARCYLTSSRRTNHIKPSHRTGMYNRCMHGSHFRAADVIQSATILSLCCHPVNIIWQRHIVCRVLTTAAVQINFKHHRLPLNYLPCLQNLLTPAGWLHVQRVLFSSAIWTN